ncbi:MAG: hypothetical protein AAGE03_06915 [Pseudomonadota bacterium]
MAGPLHRIGPLLLLLLATPAAGQDGVADVLDVAIATCASLTEAVQDQPPADWVFQGGHPIPAVNGNAPGWVREWNHPTLDISLHDAHWPRTGDRTCSLGPQAPAFEPQSLDGRANIPVTAIRAALARWRGTADLRPQVPQGWIDGQSLDCTAPGGRSLSYVTSDRHLARYQFWMIHQASGNATRRACAAPLADVLRSE